MESLLSSAHRLEFGEKCDQFRLAKIDYTSGRLCACVFGLFHISFGLFGAMNFGFRSKKNIRQFDCRRYKRNFPLASSQRSPLQLRIEFNRFDWVCANILITLQKPSNSLSMQAMLTHSHWDRLYRNLSKSFICVDTSYCEWTECQSLNKYRFLLEIWKESLSASIYNRRSNKRRVGGEQKVYHSKVNEKGENKKFK